MKNYEFEVLHDYGDLGALYKVSVGEEDYQISALSAEDIPALLDVAMSKEEPIYPEHEQGMDSLDPVNDFRTAIQSMIDAKAQEKQYDSGATIASYVNSTIPQWASEATAFVAWRDQVWAYALAELDKVQNGEREQPSSGDFLAELPAFEWPES